MPVLFCSAHAPTTWPEEKMAVGLKVSISLHRTGCVAFQLESCQSIKVEFSSGDAFHQGFCLKNSVGLLQVELLQGGLSSTAVVRL